jgi:hypothetical protein
MILCVCYQLGLLYKAFLDYTIRTFDWFHERLRLKGLLR